MMMALKHRQVHIGLADGTDTGMDDPHPHFVVEIFRAHLDGLGRTLHVRP